MKINGLNLTQEKPADPRELFCNDFDLSCFEVKDARACKLGLTAVISEVRYYTLPARALCPLCERLV